MVRWFRHVQRRDKKDATRQITVDGKRNRGRPKLRCRDLVKEDMARNQMTEVAEDRITLAGHDPSRRTTKCRVG